MQSLADGCQSRCVYATEQRFKNLERHFPIDLIILLHITVRICVCKLYYLILNWRDLSNMLAAFFINLSLKVEHLGIPSRVSA